MRRRHARARAPRRLDLGGPGGGRSLLGGGLIGGLVGGELPDGRGSGMGRVRDS